ncbi:phosphatidylethanolamine-binding protein, partial [Ochromonadaceae sp. CCMP2298]
MYCLLLVDLDSPSRKEPSMREYVHWALLNIPGNDLQRGVEVAAYQGPAPSKGSGQHRYVLCLYKQKRAFT